jgi:hypothetical protein
MFKEDIENVKEYLNETDKYLCVEKNKEIITDEHSKSTRMIVRRGKYIHICILIYIYICICY